MNEETTTNAPTSNDTSNYPIQAQIPYPETSSRGLALATIIFVIKMILLIPHLIITYFLNIFGLIAAIFAQFYILAKGKYPENMFALVKGMNIWQLRLSSYMFGLTDEYPPLAFDAQDRAKAMTALKEIIIGIIIAFVVIVLLILLANN